MTLILTLFKHSRGRAKIHLTKEASSPCPVKSLLRYIATLSPATLTSPLFDISVEDYRQELAATVAAAGIKTKLTPHSFRHGGATWAAKRGWSDSRIRSHGRWHSDAFLCYIKTWGRPFGERLPPTYSHWRNLWEKIRHARPPPQS